MSEIVLTEKELKDLEEFNRLQRILLVTTGTLQGTLCAYFGVPISVQVVSQEECNSVHFFRKTNLICKETVVCRATSDIVVFDPNIRDLIREQKYGLGQILRMAGVRPSFRFKETGQDDSTFWRSYELQAPGVLYQIKEEFPKELYDGLA
ncbi:MAG TPA: hypothetical protein VLB01_04115 [Thermodesulfobacteriota bacterium]|nr:hypothetical protein [Thermodesulfobacteriota bacterium]